MALARLNGQDLAAQDHARALVRGRIAQELLDGDPRVHGSHHRLRERGGAAAHQQSEQEQPEPAHALTIRPAREARNRCATIRAHEAGWLTTMVVLGAGGRPVTDLY